LNDEEQDEQSELEEARHPGFRPIPAVQR
jgi:hypothetical protein